MTIDPTKYRGFDLNIEMADGLFLASYHDSLNLKHSLDCWARLHEAVGDTQDEALAKAHQALDLLVAQNVAQVIGQFHDQHGVKIPI